MMSWLGICSLNPRSLQPNVLVTVSNCSSQSLNESLWLSVWAPLNFSMSCSCWARRAVLSPATLDMVSDTSSVPTGPQGSTGAGMHSFSWLHSSSASRSNLSSTSLQIRSTAWNCSNLATKAALSFLIHTASSGHPVDGKGSPIPSVTAPSLAPAPPGFLWPLLAEREGHCRPLLTSQQEDGLARPYSDCAPSWLMTAPASVN